MRKLTATQVAALTAAVGVYASTTSRYGLPLLALLPTTANSFDDDELDEIVVTATPTRYDLVIFPVAPLPGGSSSGGGGVPPPIAEAPTNANTPFLKKVVRCSLRYSVDLNTPDRRGEAPGFRTVFDSSGWAWGTSNPTLPAVVITSSRTSPPSPASQYFLIDGYTSRSARTTTIYTVNAQATATASGVSYEANLINNVVHEWSHQWDGFNSDEARATAVGNQAQSRYLQDGGDAGAPCNTAPLPPVRNGSDGGRK